MSRMSTFLRAGIIVTAAAVLHTAAGCNGKVNLIQGIRTNLAASTLRLPISPFDVSLVVQEGHGAAFRNFLSDAGDRDQCCSFRALIEEGANREIVRVTQRSADVLTVTRGQDGTTALPFSPAARVEQLAELGLPLVFWVSGKGTCQRLRIDFGDGTPPEEAVNASLEPGYTTQHTFRQWPGGKTVTAEATAGCEGKVNTRFKIEPETVTIGVNYTGGTRPFGNDSTPGQPSCAPLGSQWPPLAVNTLVKVTAISVPPQGIDFRCPGCRFDADGRDPSTDAATRARFPFPGLREFSLVLRVGSQVVQGGTNVQFTTQQAGRLEICVNADNVTANRPATGGYELRLIVHQLGPPAS